MNATTLLSRRDLLRRVVLLCCSFVENVTFYRVAWRPDYASTIRFDDHPEARFLRRAINNYFDIAVLDWCKLFGNRRQEKHHWRNVVSDPASFEQALFGKLGMTADAYKQMLDYRNNFLAHLGSGLTMNPPELDPAFKAIVFYHRHIVEHEGHADELVGLPNVCGLICGLVECTEKRRELTESSLVPGPLIERGTYISCMALHQR
jgi:hypothetical protein